MLALGLYLILATLATTATFGTCWLGSRTGTADADRWFQAFNERKTAWETTLKATRSPA